MATESHITDELVNEFSKTIELFDLSPSDSRLFTILFLNHQPMTLDEMSQTTGKSKTSVNTGIRTLSDLNLVKQVWKKGVRKDLYTTNDDLFQRFMHYYLDKWISHTTMQKRRLHAIESEIETRPQGDIIEDKVKKMIDFHQLLETSFSRLKETCEHMEER
ncbi:DNA-binding transcriptional regulator GbsR (MarR family) [Streptohalobacillus salinus]|uniref:HTH-type transcriptional regulator n=1 Tax=Streptohalobacillus salinus TaxID=621096 RepID=A0A2V3WEE5_9BACI|nr:transcriptional regulator [Streptohalobacillus salinus]PXW91458.1 DNA-binding transcriptional regulator GbsR (MarR family) [Streptohalobacillus salinus]